VIQSFLPTGWKSLHVANRAISICMRKEKMENSNQLVQKAKELGFNYEKEYKGCAQCTILAVLETLGIDNPYIFKAASGLASGGGKMCEGVCGGYAGGIMAMSLIFGRSQDRILDDTVNKNTSFIMASQLRKGFIKEYGTVICGDIHRKLFGRNFDMYDQLEYQQFEDAGAHREKCTSVVALSSSETVRILLEEADRRGMSLDDIRNIGSVNNKF